MGYYTAIMVIMFRIIADIIYIKTYIAYVYTIYIYTLYIANYVKSIIILCITDYYLYFLHILTCNIYVCCSVLYSRCFAAAGSLFP